MHPEFLPNTLQGKMAHVVEEAGEVLVMIGKINRFGMHSVDPKLPPQEQITNRCNCIKELYDLISASYKLLEELENGEPATTKVQQNLGTGISSSSNQS